MLKLKLKDNCRVDVYYHCKVWWRNGKLHRLNGPAVEYTDGGKEWWHDGKLHRDDGPAVESNDGGKWCHQNGVEVDAPPRRLSGS